MAFTVGNWLFRPIGLMFYFETALFVGISLILMIYGAWSIYVVIPLSICKMTIFICTYIFFLHPVCVMEF